MELMARVAPLKAIQLERCIDTPVDGMLIFQIRSIVLPIYYNNSEQVEARIAAFLVYIQCAIVDVPLTDFIGLVKSLQTEPNDYVKSFVYTFLSEAETSDNPHMRRVLEELENKYMFVQ